MWIFLAFLAVPMIEIGLFIQVGGLIGLWPTLGVVLLTAVIGTVLVRSQGAQALADLRTSMNEMRDPTAPLAHGAMIVFAGALLLTPGFFTDACGLALLIPQVRRAVIRYVAARVQVTGFAAQGSASGTVFTQDGRPTIIDGDFQEIDPENLPPRGPSGWTRH
ncbi:FxsA family protein [Paenirhodobacter sp. CAU 1674]|jgi:UPF0716 protein FxsA|uniref:FxsA family protein n=1 Tax=Paenirhodobacter sp. CAU 1674 TaxID=3032596 RepID=UPI0023DBA15A|nr:FxsA family protein [Paenirhodobacter sp. CAU 1674]MDF2141919.1 FxsA family protein [Paenirhodobacter sp. CAU 1674]